MNQYALTSLLAAALAPAANAQFGPSLSLGSFDRPSLVRTGDFDQDGDLDLVVAPRFEYRIYTIENLGFNQYASPVLASSGVPLFTNPNRLVVTDVDGDGLLDFCAGMCKSSFWITNRISWFRSNGDGSFEAERPILDNLDCVSELEAIDLDGDGDQDLVSLTIGQPLRVHENLGGGSFAAPQNITSMLYEHSTIAFGDFNGDAITDIAFTYAYVPAGETSVAWLPGAPGLSFGTPVAITSEVNYALDLAAADFNGDGWTDLAVTSAYSNQRSLDVFLNTSGTFGARNTVDSGPYRPSDLIASDLDRDGYAEIILTEFWHDQVYLYANLNGSGFAPRVQVDSTIDGPTASFVVDLDGDAALDLLICSANGDELILRPGDSTIGSAFCTSTANSTGVNGSLVISGTAMADANAVSLTAIQLPPNVLGIFIASLTQSPGVQPMGSQGLLCLGGDIGRFVGPGDVGWSGADGRFRRRIDTTAIPQPTQSIPALAGQTWSFQAWHRDAVGGVSTSNFTDASSVVFQ